MVKENINCWEFMKCGCAPGGKNANSLGCCPAAVQEKYNEINNGVNGGRFCWLVEETLCNGIVQTSFLNKFEICLQCEFYLMIQNQQNECSVVEQKPISRYIAQK